MTDELRSKLRDSIRNELWSDGHKRRAFTILSSTHNGNISSCPACEDPETDYSHECIWTLLGYFGLDDDTTQLSLYLADGEILIPNETRWLMSRGLYWTSRLRDEYHISIASTLAIVAATPLIRSRYAYSIPLRRFIALNAGLWNAGLDAVDVMLVHHLIHAARPQGDIHGPEFRRLFNNVYPWRLPGAITDYDPGTPRRKIWDRIQEVVTHA